MSKLKIAQVPAEFRDQMFTNMVAIRGIEGTKEACYENIELSAAFPWIFTPEGHQFWQDISEGKTPKGSVVNNEELEALAKEAEQRGFAVGVNTKYGVIRERDRDNSVFEHELTSNGSFFYRNIKVRKSNGKWIKPLGENVELISKIGKQELDADAIHAMLKKLVEKIHLN